jgi:hypothetical protein
MRYSVVRIELSSPTVANNVAKVFSSTFMIRCFTIRLRKAYLWYADGRCASTGGCAAD